MKSSSLLVANFKSNQNLSDAKTWIDDFSKDFKPKDGGEVVVCPSFTLLPLFKQYVIEHNLPIKLGAQDVSAFPQGSYTGEVNAQQVKELAEFVLIGHSERRTNLKEDEEIIGKKAEQALENGLKIIFCVQNAEQNIPKGVWAIAYEPIFAIGTGNPDTPENAQMVAEEIKKKTSSLPVLYGGSVTYENVRSFTNLSGIDGVLVGGASLDAKEFARILDLA